MIFSCRILIYSSHDDNTKMHKGRRYYLPKGIIKNYNVIINGKNFHNQLIDPDLKRYEEIRNLTTGQGEDYTTGVFWIMIILKIITLDGSCTRSMFVLTILEKIKGKRVKFYQGSTTALTKMTNYEEVRVKLTKLTNTQLSKLKSVAENRT